MLVLRLVGNGKTQSEAILMNLPNLRLAIKYSNQNNNKSRDKKTGKKHPEIAPRIYQQLILMEEQLSRGWPFSTEGAETCNGLQSILHTTSIHFLKMITDLNGKPKTLKCPQENNGKTFRLWARRRLSRGDTEKHIHRNKTKDKLDYYVS